MPCYVTARFQALPGKGDALSQAVTAVTPKVRQEDGCRRYDFHRHSEDRDSFLFYEIWESPAHLQAHGQGANMATLNQALAPLLGAAPEVLVWTAEDVQK